MEPKRLEIENIILSKMNKAESIRLKIAQSQNLLVCCKILSKMVLAYLQTCTLMKLNREPKYKLVHLQSTDLWQKCQNHVIWWSGQSLKSMTVRQLDIERQKNEIGPLSCTSWKTTSKWVRKVDYSVSQYLQNY